MRAFHCSWWGFFIAFFIWFSIAPIQSEIKDSLNLTKQELWTSSIVGVAGTVFMRFLLGPLCDKYGARALFSVVLCAASIPTACTGFVNTATGLAILRLFIGIAGGTFVMCQYWTRYAYMLLYFDHNLFGSELILTQSFSFMFQPNVHERNCGNCQRPRWWMG